MSDAQMFRWPHWDAYAGLIAAFDPNRERVHLCYALKLLMQLGYAITSVANPQRNDSLDRHMRYKIVASLRATAIFALLLQFVLSAACPARRPPAVFVQAFRKARPVVLDHRQAQLAPRRRGNYRVGLTTFCV
jgi:hypothetical protein